METRETCQLITENKRSRCEVAMAKKARRMSGPTPPWQPRPGGPEMAARAATPYFIRLCDADKCPEVTGPRRPCGLLTAPAREWGALARAPYDRTAALLVASGRAKAPLPAAQGRADLSFVLLEDAVTDKIGFIELSCLSWGRDQGYRGEYPPQEWSSAHPPPSAPTRRHRPTRTDPSRRSPRRILDPLHNPYSR